MRLLTPDRTARMSMGRRRALQSLGGVALLGLTRKSLAVGAVEGIGRAVASAGVGAGVNTAVLDNFSEGMRLYYQGTTNLWAPYSESASGSTPRSSPVATTTVDSTKPKTSTQNMHYANPVNASFTGSISGSTLTVSNVASGTINIGDSVVGNGVANPTAILSQASGTTGGVGTYNVAGSQTVASQSMQTGARTYWHFYDNNGSDWAFANQLLVSGAWYRGAWNRMTFWCWHDSNSVPSTNNGHITELGTYTRAYNGDPTTQNAGGSHWYHYYNQAGGVWTKIVVDNHPQHIVGGPTTDPGVLVAGSGTIIPGATTDSVSNYFDALTRWYWDFPYVVYPGNIYVDDVTFYNETAQDDIAHIASMEASYNPSTKLLHVGFCRNASEDPSADTTYTAVYSTTTPINTLGFANATTLGTVGPDGLGDYVNKKIEGTVDLTGVQYVYLAVQRADYAGTSTFRQMRLPINAGGIL